MHKVELDDASWDTLQNTLGASFLQSSGWAAFQSRLHVSTARFHGDGWSALCLEHTTPVGKYWYLPYGPTATSDAVLVKALKNIAAKAKAEHVTWLRVEPINSTAKPLNKLFPAAVKTPQRLNPMHTICNDLTEDEATMRSRLTPNKRNLVNRGTKRGLQFEESANPDDIAIFLDMMHEVERRTGARFHEEQYYIEQAKELMPKGMLTLEIARGPENQPLSTTILVRYQGTISRLYAASYQEARKYEAGVGLDWHTMLAAKSAGLHTYDFFGAAAPDADENDPYAGFTRYKAEFGGAYVTHGGTWDIPLDAKRYLLYTVLRRIQKLIKH